MPGVACKVLNSTHMVAGLDYHKSIPPPPPAGPAPMPHVVAYVMGLAPPSTGKISTKVMAGPGGAALGRTHDLGPGPYHVAVNALLPIVWAGAGNKAEFGVSSVKTDKGTLAVACFPFVGLNLQLDCADPCPMPTSIAIASTNTVLAGFTLGDALGGLAAGVSDFLITWAVSAITGAIVDKGIPAALGALFGPEAVLLHELIGDAFPVPFKYAEAKLGQYLGWMIGTPLGFSYDWAPGNKYGGKLNEYLDEHISNAISPRGP
jgi:hypothetical protein